MVRVQWYSRAAQGSGGALATHSLVVVTTDAGRAYIIEKAAMDNENSEELQSLTERERERERESESQSQRVRGMHQNPRLSSKSSDNMFHFGHTAAEGSVSQRRARLRHPRPSLLWDVGSLARQGSSAFFSTIT